MNTIIVQIGISNIVLILFVLFQVRPECKAYSDCRCFARLLLSLVAILFVDTVGWVIDGNPILGQIWLTTLIDGLDLFLTTLVCWCWVQYALCVVNDEKGGGKKRKWYQDFSLYLLALQLILVLSSQVFHFYFYVDAAGVYHRDSGYFIHTTLSLILLCYSAMKCLIAFYRTNKSETVRKKELLFVAGIVLIPIIGNIFQLYIYGYPTVWLCMVFMVIAVFIHIQNRRINRERERKNRELEVALAQAQNANKAKSNFLSNMSHEIRTSMNAIIGMTRLAEDEVQDNPTALAYVKEIDASSKYMLGVLNNILEMSRIESDSFQPHPQWVPGLQVFQNCISMMEPSMKEKGIVFEHSQIDTETRKSGFDLYLDDLRMKEVLMNLLNNAWKFTPPGGCVSIRLKNISHDGKFNTDQIIISDTGCGMSKEFLQHIFEPFAQERNQYSDAVKGTGLGLTIAFNYVHAMGGTLTATSELGKGSAFYITLPFQYRKSEISVIEEKAPKLTNQKELAGVRVLLAEDQPLNATIATKLLEKVGVIVELAENGEQAVNRFKETEPGHFDVILTDIRMPIMDGLTAAKEIRRLGRPDAKSIPIIAMTANAYASDREECLNAGMNEHLAKPIEPEELYRTLGEFVRK